MDAILLGDLRIAWIYAGFTCGLIVAVSVAAFFLFAIENSLNREIGALLGMEGPLLMRKGRAVFLLSFICIWALGRTILGSLGDRITSLRPISDANGAVTHWEAEYAFLKKVQSVDVQEITSWTSQIDWAGRTPMRILVLNLKGGGFLKSIKANTPQHEAALESLQAIGVEIQGLRASSED